MSEVSRSGTSCSRLASSLIVNTVFPNILNAKTTVIFFHTSLVMLLALLYHKLALENAYPELALLVKMNGYTFRGNNSTVSFLTPLLNRDQLLKQRICSSRSKFFSLKVDLILELFGSREVNRK